MDKRLFLALLLTALVVVMTPIVFPTPRPSRMAVDTGIAARTTGRADTTASGAGTQFRTQPAAGQRAPASTIGTARPTPADTGRAAMFAVAETTIVRAGGSTYRFLNPGATPVSVALDDFRSL